MLSQTPKYGSTHTTPIIIPGFSYTTDPLLSLYLTPDSGTVPNLNPYNTITFNCTVDIPNQITVQHTFDWLLNNEPISNDDGDIVHTETYSTLRVNASTPGNAIYSCCLHLPIHESPITIMRNATIIVTGELVTIVLLLFYYFIISGAPMLRCTKMYFHIRLQDCMWVYLQGQLVRVCHSSNTPWACPGHCSVRSLLLLA